MKKHILPFNWRNELVNLEADAVGDDFILLDKPLILSGLSHPFKVDVTTAIICLKGTTSGMINLERIETRSPGFLILLPNQILQYEHISEDFSALIIILSNRFTESLNIEERFPAFLSIQKQPYVELTNTELEAIGRSGFTIKNGEPIYCNVPVINLFFHNGLVFNPEAISS